MSAVVTVHGVVRQFAPKRSRKTGEIFGTEVAILTDAAGVMGETLRVLVFTARDGEPSPLITEGLTVTWAVEIENSSYGLNATFKADASSSALSSSPSQASAWDISDAAPLESVSAHS